MPNKNIINRRTFFVMVSVFFAGILFRKNNPVAPMAYYKKKFKRYLLEDCKNVPSVYRFRRWGLFVPKYTMKDFNPEYQRGMLMKCNIKKIDNKTTEAIHILACNCAHCIPREFRNKAVLKETEIPELISWMYNA